MSPAGNQRPMVLIRADGSTRIGLGHLGRMGTLATALMMMGADVLFLTKELDVEAAGRLRAQGFETEALPDAMSESEDAARTRQVIRLLGVSAVVVDHYGLGPVWWDAVRPDVFLAAVDDWGRGELAGRVDLVLNQNAGALDSWYPDVAHRFCGPAYSLVRREFREARTRRAGARGTCGPARTVLVSLGGSDPDNATTPLLEALCGIPDLERIRVVLGPAFQQRAAVMRLAAGDSRVEPVLAPPSLAPLFEQTDAAVIAGGTTLYEAMCVGVPCGVLQIAENQAPAARFLDAEGVYPQLGIAGSTPVEEVRGRFASFAASGDRLQTSASRALALVDGQGADRLARALLALAQEPA